MLQQHCWGRLCLIPLDPHGVKFFGFSEFLTGLALMVLVWTNVDERYRFRIRTAPVPLVAVTFWVVVTVGFLTLLTDLWRTEGFLVLAGNLLTPGSWQAILGGAFFLTAISWVWFALIKPPIFGKANAERFARALFSVVLKGSASEMAIVADELNRSIKSIISCACRSPRIGKRVTPDNAPDIQAFANDILLGIADKRFCRAIVNSSPATILFVFREIAASRVYGLRIREFATNVTNEALLNRDSFLFHETEGYETGLMGYLKPLSQTMFANYEMVEGVGSFFDTDVWDRDKWDSTQWEAFCRIVLMTFRDYVEKGHTEHSYVLYRAKGDIEKAPFDIYKLNGVTGSNWSTSSWSILHEVVKFIKEATEILNTQPVPQHIRLRERRQGHERDSLYDHLAELIFEVILAASGVKTPYDSCWQIQYGSVWGELFNFSHLPGQAAEVIKFKVRRLLYDEIRRMETFPNYKGARILGFCLNVMGISSGNPGYDDKDSRALHKGVLAWTRKNYRTLYEKNHEVAEACLVDTMVFDRKRNRITQTHTGGLRPKPVQFHLILAACRS